MVSCSTIAVKFMALKVDSLPSKESANIHADGKKVLFLARDSIPLPGSAGLVKST